MREIKFRAWDKTTNKMREVLGVLFHSKLVGLREDKENMFYANLFEVELMQYTGLKDKNGKEIYEGDIIRHKNPKPFKNSVYEVVFLNGGFAIIKNNDYIEDLNEFLKGSSSAEVIGNIYEDKHLLEVKHE